MTPEQFIFWLRGYFASNDSANFARGDWKVIADTLAQVTAAMRANAVTGTTGTGTLVGGHIETILDDQKRRWLANPQNGD